MGEPRRVDLSGAVAFAPSVHRRQIRETLPRRGYGRYAVQMTSSVQCPADSRFSGFKENARLWMHYMRQPFGMDPAACRRIKRILGEPETPARCSLDEAYNAGERLVFQRMALLVRADSSGEGLASQTIARILFLLGVLIHAVQDRKHLEGNPHGINSWEHFLPPRWVHAWTDSFPPDEMEAGARGRTLALLDRFERFLVEEFGEGRGGQLLSEIQGFRLGENERIEDYYPPAEFIREAVPRFEGRSAYSDGWNLATGLSFGALWLKEGARGATELTLRIGHEFLADIFSAGIGFIGISNLPSNEEVLAVPTAHATFIMAPWWSLTLSGGYGLEWHRTEGNSEGTWLVGGNLALLPFAWDDRLKVSLGGHFGATQAVFLGLQFDTEFTPALRR